jgi:hypothetical protein
LDAERKVKLVWRSSSVAEDYLLTAIEDAVGAGRATVVLVGGVMVRLLELATSNVQSLIRLTADADAGLEKARVAEYVAELERRDYERFAGQRFRRPLLHPSTIGRDTTEPAVCVIDVLVPTYTGRAR